MTNALNTRRPAKQKSPDDMLNDRFRRRHARRKRRLF